MVRIVNLITRKNIPGELYHITSKSSYKDIIRDSFIRPSQDRVLNKEAIFTIDKKNFLNAWEKTIVDNDSLKNRLLQHANRANDIVVLKISTKNLKLRNLFVRNQVKFFDAFTGNNEKMPKNPLKFIKNLIDFLHLRYGSFAFLKKFANKDKAYEYIYKDKISVKDIDAVMTLEEFLGTTSKHI